MLNRLTGVAALLAALLAQCLCTARAELSDVQQLADKVDAPSAMKIYLNGSDIVGTNSIPDDAEFDNLVLVFNDPEADNKLTLDETVRADARILVVGGGGAGGTSISTLGGAGGGGGAGGFLETTRSLEGGTYVIVVGVGGSAAASIDSTVIGEDGRQSSFDDIIAHGGGGGGAMSNGNPGGSGGGASAYYDTSKVNKVGGTTVATGDEKGNAGGAGTVAGYGGGGGGASAVGQDSSSSKSKGGAGLMSDITGEECYYAGGGGGGRTKLKNPLAGGAGGGGSGGSISDSAESGTDGLGGGGGGSGATAPGGKGGDGVVIVRITNLFESKVSVPVIADKTYNKGNQIALDFGSKYTYVEGVTNATDVGTYTFRVTPGTDCEWVAADGGGTGAKTVTWKVVAREIEKPAVAGDLVFSEGVNQVGVTVADGTAEYIVFSAESVTNAVNAGTYSYSVALSDKVNTTWAEGGTDDISGTWTIAPAKVTRPTLAATEFAYDSEEKNVFASVPELDTRYSLDSGVISATDGGSYSFVLVLIGNDEATNYVWADDESSDPYEGTWTITPAGNAINDLKMSGWRIGTTPSVPTCNPTWGEPSYVYGFGENAEDVTEWITDTSAIDVDGTWIVKATVEATDNWGAAEATAKFVMWTETANIFRDYVDIKVAPGAGTTETFDDFPALIHISEAHINGFLYSRAAADAIVFTDPDGNLLAHEVDTWNTSGTSLVWVKIPSLPPEGATIRMYWNLKDGRSAPLASTTEVWTKYAGVWHMNETATAATAATTVSKDSTANANDATPTKGTAGSANLNQMISTAGVIGNGRMNSSVTSVMQGNRLQTKDVQTVGSVFTFSGWYKMNAKGNYPRFAGTKVSDINSDGWSVEALDKSSTGVQVRGNGGSIFTVNNIDDLTLGWVYLTFVYDNTTARIYSNGRLAGSGNVTAVVDTTQPLSFGAHGSGNEWSLNGAYDELRIAGEAFSAQRIAADIATVTNADFAVQASPVSRDGVKVNYWVADPTVVNPADPTKVRTSWDVSEEPSVIGNPGELAFGAVSNYIHSIYDATETYADLSELTNAGSYRIVFVPKATEDFDPAEYEPISKAIELHVTESQPYEKIGGTNGDSGRILLMNRDTNTKNPIDYQGFSDNKATLNTYWNHLNADGAAGGGTLPFNLQLGTESQLMTKGGERRLWHIVNCRHGNTCPVGATDALSSVQNYLPYSSTSKSFKSRATNVRQNTPGQVVMRNMGVADPANADECAVVYSSCFTDGIGTIYFDAVNGWCRNNENYENYKIAVEICTNTVDGLVPTDINSFTEGTEIDDDAVEHIVTNWYGNLEGQWIPVEMTPYKRDVTGGTNDFERLDATNELALAVQNGGTMDNFYRVVVPLDIAGPVRFRIRRVTEVPHSGTGAYGVDEGGFILLDNIIASLPAMRGDLYSEGVYDSEKTKQSILGWELAASVPYPSRNDSGVIGRARAEYYVNAGDGSEVDTSTFISSAKMHYRWRYLNQKMSEWAEIDLNPQDGFKALAPFALPGHACDVEYWYEYVLHAPYYTYVNYSGVAESIDYSEERGVITNRLGATSLPSCGTDWFFRVRDGKSEYSGFDIVYELAGKADRVHMTLVGNNSWRGFIQTREDKAGELKYRFEAFDRQTGEYAQYAASTNFFYCPFENAAMPISSSFDVGTADDWSTLAADAVTGYVMFQLDEKTKSLTVVHADYQNFDGWTDALNRKDYRGRSPIFVGTSTTNEYKVGVSPTKQTFSEDFSDWLTMPATNAYWQVPTYSDIYHLYGHPAYETFSSDTNGLWAIGQGMWVSKRYREDKDGSGVAIQMEGNGKGYLQFTDTAAAPRGIESVTFNARLGQFIRFDDFAYYYGSVISKMQNYTFVARAAFDLNSNKDFAGNASLSLVANYLPSKGCYEARLEWIGRNLKTDNGSKDQRLCLYRWNVNGDGTKTSTLVTAWTNNIADVSKVTGYDASGFIPYLISVSNDVANACTWVLAGVRIGNNTGVSLGTDWVSANDKWQIIRYRDNSSQRLTKGTYGVLSANCPGVFGRPQISKKSLPTVVNPNLGAGKSEYNKDQNLAIKANLTDLDICANDFKPRADPDEEIDWNIIPGRMTNYYSTDVRNAIQSSPVAQKLEIYVGTAGRADFGATPLTTVDLNGFGGSPFTIPLYTTKDCSIKFAVAGTLEDVRTDVVIDSVSLKQWRGGNWDVDGSVNGVSQYLPDWADPAHRADINGYSNFVFTSCWIINNTVLMSAKRADLTTPSAIRSPLMDGFIRNGSGGDGTARGKGLGMISVEYKDAQPNAALVLQIATNNVDRNTVDGYDKSFNPATWTTVTNFDFSVMSAAERKSGVLNAYIGLHDVAGVMRVMVSTNSILAVKNITDPTKFGEVTITKIVCRDEPAVDVHSWWGWNMRTVGGDEDSEKRMFLQDYSTEAGAMGLSGSLNNSVANDSAAMIDLGDRESYLPHKPFIQTPTFTSNIVGEVSFKARKYSPNDPTATLVLFGSVDASATDEGTWSKIDGAVFSISNSVYETYSYKTDPGQSFKAFRLAVVGVPGVKEDASGGGNALPPGVLAAERVLLDEVYVSEAVRARMGFRNVGCFKSDMAGTGEVPGVPGEREQPLCNEAWGVQCEIYGAQLPDDIDFSRKPRVTLHWYDRGGTSVTGGLLPWGYENWKDLPGHKSALLSAATGVEEGRYVYRTSQRTSPNAVIGMSVSAPTYVQYTLEVEYYTKGSSVPITNFLSQAEWGRTGKGPDWYRPLDLNSDPNYGNGKTFAAYNILDTVAPGWAWINEVNVFGEFVDSVNTDNDIQYVEIAQPPEADISEWSVRLIEAQTSNDMVQTNQLAVFGDNGLDGTKDAKWIAPEANMVFRVIGNKQSRDSGRLSYANGTLDGIMQFNNSYMTCLSGDDQGNVTISPVRPFALQLVRKSGIVEHEIVVMGTNWWSDLPPVYVAAYHPTNAVAFLNERMAGAEFFYVGKDDDGGEPNSLGVWQNRGRATNDWSNAMVRTPGRINEGQSIDPDHPVPSGEDILVYLTVSGDHIQQWDGESFTNAMLLVSVAKGSKGGTNVTYRVDPWHVVGAVTTNGVSAIDGVVRTKDTQPYEFVLQGVGKGASNNVVVVASAMPDPKLAEYGVGEDNEYRPAIVEWLLQGTDLYGNPFADVESGEIRLAEFCSLNGTVVTNMTLTEMYWLDMDPTSGQLALIGGISEGPSFHDVTAWDDTPLKNIRLGVYMMMTNKSETAAVPEHRRGANDFGTHWTPYALRGLEPGSSSLGYNSQEDAWKSVTFKVTGMLMNGIVSEKENRMPLRWFVFNEDSFTPEGVSRIEIEDPYWPDSVGYNTGWGDWWEKEKAAGKPLTGIGWFWSIDTRLQPADGVSTLKQENYYGE